MDTNYDTLFTIRIKHDYYADGWAKGLRLLPSPSTQRRMKNYRMLFRNMPFGAVVLYRYRKDDAGAVFPFISLPDEMVFTFAMYTDDQAAFRTITNISQPKKYIYFENDPESADAEEEINIAWLEEPGAPYHDILDAAEGLAALVEIRLNKPVATVAGKKFLLQFERRSAVWKYRIVNKGGKIGLSPNPPEIALSADADPPPAYGSLAFGAAVEVADEEEKVQGLETWHIMSAAALPFYELPLQNLELLSGTNTLARHLPGASSTSTLKWNEAEERYESEIYVFV